MSMIHQKQNMIQAFNALWPVHLLMIIKECRGTFSQFMLMICTVTGLRGLDKAGSYPLFGMQQINMGYANLSQ
jgi:hypothetical protein